MSEFSRKVATSRFARGAALPIRARDVARHDARVLATSARWLMTSREHTNYTYDLTPRNTEHLAWWVASVSERPISEIRSYLRELLDDEELVQHVESATLQSARRGLADRQVRFGRRLGWYALTRALKPAVVVETGTDKGLGSCVFAAALLRNQSGRLVTVDVNPDSGYLIGGQYERVVERRVGDSVAVLKSLQEPVDVFLHDSLHTPEHERAEFTAVAPCLAPNALVLSDNAHETDELAAWAEQTGRTFSYFQEMPAGHWWPGAGIGAAWRP